MSDDIETVASVEALLHATYDRHRGTLHVEVSTKVNREGGLYRPIADMLSRYCHTEDANEVRRDRKMARYKSRRLVYTLHETCSGDCLHVRHGRNGGGGRIDAKTPVSIGS